jgi:hypothetical protein
MDPRQVLLAAAGALPSQGMDAHLFSAASGAMPAAGGFDVPSVSAGQQAAGLDAVASEGQVGEALNEAVLALFPETDASLLSTLCAFLASEGAKDRPSILAVLRAQRGEAAVHRAQIFGLSLFEVAAIEAAAMTADAPALSTQQANTNSLWCTPPWFLPGWMHANAPPPVDEEQSVDFGILRPYLDKAGLGEPGEHGIPSKKTFNEAVAASRNFTVPHVQAIPPWGHSKGVGRKTIGLLVEVNREAVLEHAAH